MITFDGVITNTKGDDVYSEAQCKCSVVIVKDLRSEEEDKNDDLTLEDHVKDKD